MRAVMIMYDSLNRNFLEPYGSTWVKTPNFLRLARKAVTFDNFYAGSLPCMPARRELHTGRLNFLHRGWSPLEPFDESMPQLLKEQGIYSHLITDHYHYWEDGGSTYHNRFVTYDFIRGQEGDRWASKVEGYDSTHDMRKQDKINRLKMKREEDHYHVRAFHQGIQFIQENIHTDNWYLQLEYYDPHEPFFVPDRFKKLYSETPVTYDWPQYQPLENQNRDSIREARLNYAALVSMCDEYLGHILDLFDTYDLWKDTLLIVNTDHGFLLGEHGYVGKNYMPVYNEIANIPFFLWDPRNGISGQRRSQLAQTIDIPTTILHFFSVPVGKHMQGGDLRTIVEQNRNIHESLLFGYFGMHVNITDGRYVYMRSAVNQENQPLYQYTLMPMHISKLMSKEELKQADPTLYLQFMFTDNTPLLRIPVDERYDKRRYFKYSDHIKYGNLLFDLKNDPNQTNPITDKDVEDRLLKMMKDLMQANDAPLEQYTRLGLSSESRRI
jgi:arylsulfatase A-like enzyme